MDRYKWIKNGGKIKCKKAGKKKMIRFFYMHEHTHLLISKKERKKKNEWINELSEDRFMHT